MNGWAGDHPLFLIISPFDGRGNVGIDLDTRWLTDHADLLRIPALWQCIVKETGAVLMAMYIYEGEQPYFVKRHVGVTGGGSNETFAYGMGKKLTDGTTYRMWVLENGTFCMGDDVDTLGVNLVKQMGPR